MSNIAIICHSTHHGNTKKVVDEMAKAREIDIFTITQAKEQDFSSYEYIGFASGIYYQSLSKDILKLAQTINFNENQKIFIVYTCGAINKKNTSKLERIINDKGLNITDTFSCKGYDTFGPFKLIGGIAKGHPNAKDLDNAKAFITNL